MVVLKLDDNPKNCGGCPLCTDYKILVNLVRTNDYFSQFVYDAKCNYYKQEFRSQNLEKRPELCPLEELKEDKADTVEELRETLHNASSLCAEWGNLLESLLK